ncbi:MAG: hypothetical protein AB8B84_07000 [Granulosicoccus sp.]
MTSDVNKECQIEADERLIKAELERVLGLQRFSSAPQMSAFLRYIVTETLNGHADRIKAFSVGVDALGKPDTFDAQSDPSVRVLALRLRKTLTEVYEDQQGCAAIIELTVGTYVPSFYKVGGCGALADVQDSDEVVLANHGNDSRRSAQGVATNSAVSSGFSV